MNKVTLPPSIAALSKSCQTICEVDCCGLGAYSFSPFNIIYHLAKWSAKIRQEDLEVLNEDLLELSNVFQGLPVPSQEIVVEEWNAILTEVKLQALVGEIGSAISEASAIYCCHKDRIDERFQKYIRIISG